MIKIVVVAYEGCLGSGYFGLTDILSLSAQAIAKTTGETPYDIVTASADGKSVKDAAGRPLPVEASAQEIAACDAILLPPLSPDAETGPSVTPSLAAWLRRRHAQGALVAACGAGAFALGEAGLLDGRRCATDWWLHDALKRRFPRADVAWGANQIEDRRVVTTSGPMSWADLALYVIGKLAGDAAARIAADFTLRQGDAKSHETPTANSFLAEAERIVRQAGETSLGAQDLARALATSERTLHRKLKEASGESPKNFIDRVRVETARTLLENGSKSVKELSAAVGFSDEASFRRAFRRFAGMAPGAYRSWMRFKNQHKAHIFSIRKESELIPEILTRILDSCVNGVTLADPEQEDSPIVYANKEFERITGYGQDEIIGRNCRFLQGEDRDQEGLRRIRDAIARRQHIEITLRNYRKDGSLFHNRLNITPLFDAEGKLIYFLGVQFDVSDQVRAEHEALELKERLSALEARK